jgi:hypothetical protein
MVLNKLCDLLNKRNSCVAYHPGHTNSKLKDVVGVDHLHIITKLKGPYYSDDHFVKVFKTEATNLGYGNDCLQGDPVIRLTSLLKYIHKADQEKKHVGHSR